MRAARPGGPDRQRRALIAAGAVGIPAAVVVGALPAGASPELDEALESHFGCVSAADHGFLPSATGTDNRVALQAAVDEAVAEGRDLFVPPGDYGVELSSSVPQVLVGGDVRIFSWPGRVRIAAGPDTPTFAYRLLHVAAGARVEVDGLHLLGPATPGAGGASGPITSGITVEAAPAGGRGSLHLRDVTVSGRFLHPIATLATGPATPTGRLDLELERVSVEVYHRGISIAAHASARTSLRVTDGVLIEPGTGTPTGELVRIDGPVSTSATRTFLFNTTGGRWAWRQGATTSPPPDRVRWDQCQVFGWGRTEISAGRRVQLQSCLFRTQGNFLSLHGGADIHDCTFRPMASQGAGTVLLMTTWGGFTNVVRGCFVELSDTAHSLSVFEAGSAGDELLVTGTTFRTTTPANHAYTKAINADATVRVADCTFLLGTTGNCGFCQMGMGRHRFRRVTVTGRGTHDVGFLRASHADLADALVEDCDFSGITNGPAIWVATAASGRVRGTGNRFVAPDGTNDHGRPVTATAGTVARLAPRQGLATTPIASASTLTVTWDADTYRVTGAASIGTVSVAGRSGQERCFAGTAHLVADGAWTLRHQAGGTGNIRTATGADHTVQPGSVISLTHDPATLTWHEGA